MYQLVSYILVIVKENSSRNLVRIPFIFLSKPPIPLLIGSRPYRCTLSYLRNARSR
jgi:hypothetical protein